MKGLARIDLLPLEILPLQLGLVIDAPRHVYGTYYFVSIFERKSPAAPPPPLQSWSHSIPHYQLRSFSHCLLSSLDTTVRLKLQSKRSLTLANFNGPPGWHLSLLNGSTYQEPRGGSF